MPDLVLILTLVSIAAMGFALWRVRHHGCKLDSALHRPEHD